MSIFILKDTNVSHDVKEMNGFSNYMLLFLLLLFFCVFFIIPDIITIKDTYASETNKSLLLKKGEQNVYIIVLENVRCLLNKESSDNCEAICKKGAKCIQSSILASIQNNNSL
jgi:hypothetical protein